jgi:dUTP pyrophosphatase
MIIEFVKEHSEIKTPSRSNPSDAGLDIYADLFEPATIEPGANKMIPTGLHFGIPHGFMLQVCNRSSMAAKRSLVVGAHIIDSGYDGEVFIDLHNIGPEPQVINNQDKIAQLVMVPVIHFRTREVSSASLYENQGLTISSRGDGALGSTDAPVHPLSGVPVGGF